MGTYDHSDDQCQPCQVFTPEIGYFGMERHCCPQCKKDDATRVFCKNCNRDHHSGGWNNCDPQLLFSSMCQHPACIKARKELEPQL